MVNLMTPIIGVIRLNNSIDHGDVGDLVHTQEDAGRGIGKRVGTFFLPQFSP